MVKLYQSHYSNQVTFAGKIDYEADYAQSWAKKCNCCNEIMPFKLQITTVICSLNAVLF